MQHPWILPFLTTAPIQLALSHHSGVQQVPTGTMGLTLQPVMTPSGTLLLPALNAAAAAAVAAAQAQAQGPFSVANPSVLMGSFPRARLKVFISYVPSILLIIVS